MRMETVLWALMGIVAGACIAVTYESWINDRTPLAMRTTPEHIQRLAAKIPMGRIGEPEEVAEIIRWASSPRCSFTTASVIDASGGRTTY